jgi:hypothetical protein
VPLNRSGATPAASAKRGRPVGSVKLTIEIQRTILAMIEAGTFDYVAAEAAGIAERTFRDWVHRGEGRHPTRRATSQLKAFANAVRGAKARARASREITVADTDPKFWLTHAARSKPGREGWTDPIEVPDEQDEAPQAYEPTPAELAETLKVLVAAGVIELAECGDPTCGCAHHQGGRDDEDE